LFSFGLQYGLVVEDLFRGKIEQSLFDVVYEMACLSKAHLDHARELKEQAPKQAAAVFLPAVSRRCS
jgi:hypothetical protein